VLRITVIKVNGYAPANSLAQEFDERGGTIGREDSNALVLPDPNRHISRMQAQVQFDGTRFMLIDHGGNPTQLNGRPLGKGNSATLRDGDEITIAEYSLRVEVLRESAHLGNATQPNVAAQMDPLGLFGSAPGDGQVAPAPAPGPAPAAKSAPLDDDPFAVFIPAGPATTPAPSPAAAAPIADDPFAAFAPKAAATPASAPPSSLGGDPLGIGAIAQPPAASSLDDLFGLDVGGASHDPFAGSPLGDPAHAPAPLQGGSADPLALLGGATPDAGKDAVRNDSPLLRDAFTPPRLIDDQPRDAPAVPQSPPPARPAITPAAPAGGVVSWATPDQPAAVSDPAGETHTRIVPPAAIPTPRAHVTVDAPAGPAATPVAAPSTPSAAPSATPHAAPPAGTDALLAAFSRGLGLPQLQPPGGLTPAFMEHLGLVVREAVQGTVELLIARAATKREVRADVTMIVSKNNNPLKFSPDVDFALMQLINPQGGGFMGPAEAMRDAYDDLRAHQIGFIAGMRAALASVLARFTPAELEARLTSRSLFDSVLPANRKAKLWDLYEQRYQDISREAEDDFHSLFGREFLKAYEAQIEQLQRDRG